MYVGTLDSGSGHLITCLLLDLTFSIVLIIRINTVDNVELLINNQNAQFGSDATWNLQSN